ncbi:MAG: sensor histidine kinase [Xanthomonadales bacterium]|nr:sensor histidine kinase [Xanthomonadales bacterium]
MRFSTNQLLMFAGLFTWACVGVFLTVAPILDERPPPADYLMWVLPYVVFGVAYWQLVWVIERRQSLRTKVLLLLLLTLCALEVSHLSHSGLGRTLLLIVAGVLPWTLPLSWGVGWLLGQNLAHAAVLGLIPGVRWTQAAVLFGLYLGFSSFAFVMSMVGRRQSEGRGELRKLNSELRATQALLAESTRIAERVRISRELHDLVGHHLTALSLNLEVASHLVKGKALEHVTQAQTVAKLLLSDVREVVGAMRGDDHIDLTQALMSLSEGVPRPVIHMEIPEHLKVDDPQRAQVVLRCTQEIITNTVKHADADNLWLTIRQTEKGLSIHARDDGRGTDQLDEGNGLLGMGERLRQLGGKLSVSSDLGKGFRLDAWLPREVVI